MPGMVDKKFPNAGSHSGYFFLSLNLPGLAALLTVSDWSFSTRRTSALLDELSSASRNKVGSPPKTSRVGVLPILLWYPMN